MSRENLQSNIGDEKSAFLTRMRDEAAIVHAPEFALLSRMYLSKIPLCGAAAFRLAGGIEGILINYDYFQQTLGVDYIATEVGFPVYDGKLIINPQAVTQVFEQLREQAQSQPSILVINEICQIQSY